MFTLGRYSKFWIALIGAIVAALTIYFRDEQWLPVVVSFLTAIGVYASPNTDR